MKSWTIRIVSAIIVLGAIYFSITEIISCNKKYETANKFTSLVFTFSTQAQLTGLWKGELNAATQNLKLNIKFYEENGKLAGNIDIPEQYAFGLKLSSIKETQNNIKFEVIISSALTMKFDGTLAGDYIKGNFDQMGIAGTFELKKERTNEEEVIFYNDKIKLCGTLSIPDRNKKNPAVILISGNAQNRDEAFGFPIYKILSDTLTKNGYAVLRFDSRGIGSSDGVLMDINYDDLSSDISSAINLLKKHEYIDANKIGLMGHCEGGAVASITAVKTKDVGFIILLAGTGDYGSNILVEQSSKIARLEGVPEKDVIRDSIINTSIVNTVIHDTGWVNSKLMFRKYVNIMLETDTTLTEVKKKELAEQILQTNVATWKQPWFKAFLTTNPADYLEQINIPVLAIFAEKDVTALTSCQKIETVLKRSKNKNYKIITVPNANHLFQISETGLPSEFPVLKKEFEPSLLPAIIDWLNKTVK